MQVTICPCCGFKFTGSLTDGCHQCGARAVGDALPQPARMLPSYGRALVLVVSGSLFVLVFDYRHHDILERLRFFLNHEHYPQ